MSAAEVHRQLERRAAAAAAADDAAAAKSLSHLASYSSCSSVLGFCQLKEVLEKALRATYRPSRPRTALSKTGAARHDGGP